MLRDGWKCVDQLVSASTSRDLPRTRSPSSATFILSVGARALAVPGQYFRGGGVFAARRGNGGRKDAARFACDCYLILERSPGGFLVVSESKTNCYILTGVAAVVCFIGETNYVLLNAQRGDPCPSV